MKRLTNRLEISVFSLDFLNLIYTFFWLDFYKYIRTFCVNLFGAFFWKFRCFFQVEISSSFYRGLCRKLEDEWCFVCGVKSFCPTVLNISMLSFPLSETPLIFGLKDHLMWTRVVVFQAETIWDPKIFNMGVAQQRAAKKPWL